MKYLTLFLSLFVTINLSAQIIENKEPAILEVHYIKTSVSDTLKNQSSSDPMTLRIGKTSAMFYPTKKMWADSLMKTNFNLYQKIHYEMNPLGSQKAYNPPGGFEREFLFRNINDGETMVYRRMSGDGYSYTEPTEAPIWEIMSDTAEIMGYICHLATCHYRGRIWNAWFSPDIPINEGPWKLFGLPGLVLKAYDSKNHYTYNAVAIYTKDLLPVGIKLYVRRKPIQLKDRQKYLQMRYKNDIKGDFVKKMSAAFGGKDAQGETKDAQRDFQERDYPHVSK